MKQVFVERRVKIGLKNLQAGGLLDLLGNNLLRKYYAVLFPILKISFFSFHDPFTLGRFSFDLIFIFAKP